MSSARSTILVAMSALALSACIFFVSPDEYGDHCRLSAATSDCATCVALHCQAPLDTCCLGDACGELVASLEQCAGSHDASCNTVRSSVTSTSPTEAKLAACVASQCAASCVQRTGSTITDCNTTRAGASTCSCSIGKTSNDVECSEVAVPGTRCCASRGWPGPALACTCKPFACVQSGGGCYCSLNEYAPPDYATSCNGGPGLHCCAYNDHCECRQTDCAAPERTVPTCTIDTVQCDPQTPHVDGCTARKP